MTSRQRFGIALGVAALLGAWLLVASLGGALEQYAGPGEVRAGEVYRLNGHVGAEAPADAAESPERRGAAL